MSRLTVAAALLMLVAGCRPEDRSPLGAARKFLQAVEVTDTEAIHALLAPATKAKLAELLHLANAQAGGPRKLKPEDLLVAGMYRLPMAASMEVGQVTVSGDRATVEVLNRKKVVHRLVLTRTDKGLWRVVLPDSVLQPPEPGAPGSQPTSAPTPEAQPTRGATTR